MVRVARADSDPYAYSDVDLDVRLADWAEIRGGGGRGGEGSIFGLMKEYQAVLLQLARRSQENEDALTDLLNERSRAGWEPALMSQDTQRLTVVFQRMPSGESTDAP